MYVNPFLWKGIVIRDIRLGIIIEIKPHWCITIACYYYNLDVATHSKFAC